MDGSYRERIFWLKIKVNIMIFNIVKSIMDHLEWLYVIFDWR